MKLLIIIIFYFTSLLFGQNQNYTILISFDGFRWDYSLRGITPTIDSIKTNGVHAVSLRPVFPSKTFPNHTSIITGMYCDSHGIISNGFADTSGNWNSLSNISKTNNTDWYKGEALWETLKKNNINTACYFWPASDMNNPERRPDKYELYEHKRPYEQRIEGIINLLKLPYNERPKFLTLYFDATDTYGHNFGPNSDEINYSIKRLDSLINNLFNGFVNINLQDSVNVIIVSDHGMTEISPDKYINIGHILKGFDCIIQDYGPFMTINSADNNIDDIYTRLKENENHFKVYTKDNIPGYFHYSNDKNIYPLILSAELGWSLITDKNLKWLNTTKGNHGYNNNYIDMHGTFIAAGPDFKKGYKTGTIWNIDIYPLLCKLYGIAPNKNIDGKLERIEFILK
ncbi:MAG: ectonucleotide pyrophosphatase/phosphodiesterase [Bacteroidetes bacterium]|nr:ectonucleotide pyrophosphatase/phosphodiesterase [Bacteroidota bacterium]